MKCLHSLMIIMDSFLGQHNPSNYFALTMNGLDIEGVQQIKQLLIQLKNEGRTILLVSHNHEDIEELCDAVYEMSMGKVEQKK